MALREREMKVDAMGMTEMTRMAGRTGDWRWRDQTIDRVIVGLLVAAAMVAAFGLAGRLDMESDAAYREGFAAQAEGAGL